MLLFIVVKVSSFKFTFLYMHLLSENFCDFVEVLEREKTYFFLVPHVCVFQSLRWLLVVLQLKEEVLESRLKGTISQYRDDADLQNFIDWVQADWASISSVIIRVPTRPGKSWDLRKEFFRAWKVMENNCGHGKSWRSHEIPPIG